MTIHWLQTAKAGQLHMGGSAYRPPLKASELKKYQSKNLLSSLYALCVWSA